ncbi:MAG: PorT family protein [Flavobacteriales bacterium]|nr:PorT family protein [Flavobacteriales bacterium]MDP4954031.1 PorT family protein [Flavobacteriales bacterium]
MKNILLLFVALLSTQLMGAQELEPAKKDTTKIAVGDLKLVLVNDDKVGASVSTGDDDDDEPMTDQELKSALTFWSGVDAGVNILLDKNNSTDFTNEHEWLDLDYSRSMSWSFNLVDAKIRLVKDYVGIYTGLGLTYNSYGLKENVRLMANNDSTYANIIPTDRADSLGGYIPFTKNKLRASYLRIPLMLEFNTSLDPERTFHVSAGVIGGWNMGTINKVKYEEDGNDVKNRSKGDYNLTPFTLDASVRVGYRNFTLFANYGLTPLFEDGKGPEVYPLTVGLCVIPFNE